MNIAKFRLIRVASYLFPDENTTIMALSQIEGLHTERINLSLAPEARWFYIVNECDKSGLLPRLVTEMLLHYPNNTELQQLRKDLAANIV